MPFSGTVLNSQVPFGIVPQAADVSFWADGLCTQPPGTPRTLPGGSDLAAWYNARDTASLTIDGSDRVSLWQDRSGLSDEPGLVLPGVAGNYASAPDSVPLSITGDIDIRWFGALPSWTPAADTMLVSKWNSTGSNRSYWLSVFTDGTLKFNQSTDGSTAATANSTAATGVSNFASKWVRVTLDVDNGAAGRTVTFYLSDDGVVWTQLGSPVVIATAANTYDSTAQLNVGSSNDGAFTLQTGFNRRVQIRNGIDGPIVFDADFTKQAKLTTSFTESSVNAATVTVNQSGDLPARITGARDLYQGTVAKMAVYTGVETDTAIYTSDFSAGVDGWGPGTGTTLNAPITVGGETNSLEATRPDSGTLILSRSETIKQGAYVRVTGLVRVNDEYDAPYISFDDGASGGRGVIDAPAANAWVAFETVFRRTLTGGIAIRAANNLAGGTATVAADSRLFFKDLVLTVVANPTPYLYFDGSNDFLKSPPFALSQPTTVYFVGEQVTWTDTRTIIDGNSFDAGQRLTLLQRITTPTVGMFAGSGPVADVSTWAIGNRAVMAAVFSGAQSSLRMNLLAAASGDAGTSSANGFTLGARASLSNWSNIAVSEIVIFAAIHDTATQNRIIRALARQGSIAV